MTREPAALEWVLHAALGRIRPRPGPEEWRRAIPALQASRLLPLATHLLGPQRANLPADIVQVLEAATLDSEARTEQAREQLREASEVLQGLEVEWVVLKGWPLAVRLYETPALRPSGDLDLLVRAEVLDQVAEAFARLGYQPEGERHPWHLRLVREGGQGEGVIELHRSAGPVEQGGPSTAAVLSGCRQVETPAGTIPVPGTGHELDLLIRHYLRHAGYQAILLLDIGLLAGTGGARHSHGALVGDDFERIDLPRLVDGPARARFTPLRRWMGSRTFLERRSSRHIARVEIPLALAESPGAILGAVGRLAWPAEPTPRWVAASQGSAGWTWRFRRLFSFRG